MMHDDVNAIQCTHFDANSMRKRLYKVFHYENMS